MPRGEAPLMQYGAERRGRKKTRVPAFQNPKGPFRLLLRGPSCARQLASPSASCPSDSQCA
jgi:hypothetical protein